MRVKYEVLGQKFTMCLECRRASDCMPTHIY